MKLNLLGAEQIIHFTVPDVGVMGRTHPNVVAIIGITDLGYIWGAGTSAREAVMAKYGQSPGTGGARQDAIRHSTWNCVVAQRLGLNRTVLATTANEYTSKMDMAGISSNSVMDLNNNYQGALHGQLQTTELTLQQAIEAMELQYDSGNVLIKWIPESNSVENHHGMVRWSNGPALFNN